jgi:predicted Na+-dependent transporter
VRAAQVGTLVPVDAGAMFLSTLQLVLAPVLIGAVLNQTFPRAVSKVRVVMPLVATALVVMIVGSMISANVEAVKASGLKIVSAVFVLHGSGFALGYFISKVGAARCWCVFWGRGRGRGRGRARGGSWVAGICAAWPGRPGWAVRGVRFQRRAAPAVASVTLSTHPALHPPRTQGMGLSDKICRTNSIEVGMQSSALAAVLARTHFADPVVAAPCVLSACTHATMGSLLAGYWRLTAKDDEAVKNN